jgi:hypothetical protein
MSMELIRPLKYYEFLLKGLITLVIGQSSYEASFAHKDTILKDEITTIHHDF